ncbi:serine hydrolase domain-containing protein [Parvicella tangerina]|nr:serine hydrolase domain-containing protein [Parvicella tangerina]
MERVIIAMALIVVLLLSCGIDQENTVDKGEKVVEIVPDSTAYFDSVYAPYKISLDTFFRNKFEQTHFYGTVLFAQRGRIIFENVYGYANLQTKDTLTLDHTFQLASASKPFTAVAILQLVEQGKITLSDEMHKFFPSFPYDGITVEQLLAHRSGMSQYTHFCDAPDTIWPDKHKTITNNDVIKIMSEIKPMINYAPNQTHYYCNTNYMLLASIVEKVSGVSFSDYLKTNIFQPSGMTHTVLYTRDNDDELILPTIGYNGAFNPTIDIYLNGVVGDKGIYSNVHDMLKFDQALYNGTLLQDSTVALMMTDHNELQSNGQNYGYGFRIYPEESTEGLGRIVFHTGWWKGFRTYFIRVPKQEKTIIVLTHIKRGKFLDIKELVSLIKSL